MPALAMISALSLFVGTPFPSFAAVGSPFERSPNTTLLDPILAFSDDFSSDPNTSGRWSVHRFSEDPANEVSWDAGAGQLYLTRAVAGTGVAMFAEYDLAATKWNAAFRFRTGGGTGDTNTPPGADGFVFMFYKNKAAYGRPAGGSYMGFQVDGWPSPPPLGGYGIEFDTYKQDGPSTPFAVNHVALIQDQVPNHLGHIADTRLEDNRWHSARISYDEGLVDVWIDNELVLLTDIATPNYTYTGIGFGSGTGIYTNNHVIDDFVLTMDTRPLLNLPVSPPATCEEFARMANGNYGASRGRVNSWFDHRLPFPYRSFDDHLVTWNGQELLDPQVGPDCTYGYNCYDNHNGIDFQHIGAGAESVYAAAPGVVADIWDDWPASGPRAPGYGNYILLDHGGGLATFYAHLASVRSELGLGSRVDDLTVPIGIMGNTGTIEVHLHFAAFIDENGVGGWTEDEVIDPFGWHPLPTSAIQNDPWHMPSTALWKCLLNPQAPADGAGTHIVSASGRGGVVVPPGALASSVTLELWDTPPIAEPSAGLHSARSTLWFRVLEWEGAGQGAAASADGSPSFDLPVSIQISYDPVEVLHLDVSQLAVHWWDEHASAWVPLLTDVDDTLHLATASSGVTGGFDLQAPLLCPIDSREPNDTFAAASPLFSGTPRLDLVFDIASDEDWYILDAQRGERFAATTDDLAGGVDTILELYAADGATLLLSDDNGGGGNGSRLEWAATSDTAYYLRVLPAPGSGHGCEATFALQVTSGMPVMLPLVVRGG
jgi:murein DD-endopeptidase MepM/ murein hydrolase activator NlpD